MLHEIIRKNQWLYGKAIMAKGYVPEKIEYCKEYQYVKQVLKKQEEGKDIENILKLRLIEVLKNAIENVPFYKEINLQIDSKEINPENVYHVLKQFPYIDKKTVISNPESFISKKYSKSIEPMTSSGSTGEGIKVWTNRKEKQIEQAFFDYYWGKTGLKKTSRILKLNNAVLKAADEEPCELAGNYLRVSPYHVNEKWIGEIYQKILEFQPQYIHGYPSNIEYLAVYMKRNKLQLNCVKAIFLSSEKTSMRLFNLLDEVFKKTNIHPHYGLTERTNLAWGEVKDGKIRYKLEEVYGYSENFTNNGKYEIVGTSYWNMVMPLIKYRTKDYGKIENGYITHLEGREQEFLITKEGNIMHGVTYESEIFYWDYIDLVQIVQNEPGKIELQLRPKSNFNEEAYDRILNHSRKVWGSYFDITIVVNESIKKSNRGKIVFIVNNTNKEK